MIVVAVRGRGSVQQVTPLHSRDTLAAKLESHHDIQGSYLMWASMADFLDT